MNALGRQADELRLDPHSTRQAWWEANRAWAELSTAIGPREAAPFPSEVPIGALLPGLLAAGGIVWPLAALGAPSNVERAVTLGVWVVLLAAFVVGTYIRAHSVLTNLMAVLLAVEVQRRYEDDMRQVEAMLEDEEDRERPEDPTS